MFKINGKQAKRVACLLSFTLLTSSGCMLKSSTDLKQERKSYLIENYIESDDVTKNNANAEFISTNYRLLNNDTNNTYDNSLSSNVNKSPLETSLEELLNSDFGYSEDMQAFYNEHFEIIENLSLEDNQNIRKHYAKLAYQKLLDNNIPFDVMVKELNNLMIEQQVPSCLDIEDWYMNFGSLISTLNDEESLYSTYFTLANYMHQQVCKEEHELDLGITCKTLVKEYNHKYQKQS